MKAWLSKWSVIKNAKTYAEVKCSHYYNTLFIISFSYLVPEFTVYTLTCQKSSDIWLISWWWLVKCSPWTYWFHKWSENLLIDIESCHFNSCPHSLIFVIAVSCVQIDLNTIPHNYSIRLMSSKCDDNTICQKFLECVSNQFWATDGMHYPC